MHEQRGVWGSKLAFILAAAGSAVGLGNVWRFPVEVGKNGGAAYVVVYLACVLLLGVPVMMAEFSLGRATGKNILGAFIKLAPRSLWIGVGILGILTGVGILSYYGVVAGWTLGYFIKAIFGTFHSVTTAKGVTAMFVHFTASPLSSIVYFLLFMLMTMGVVAGGVEKGIERWCKILMPSLFIILLLLVLRAVTLKGAHVGLDFYLHPDFSKLTSRAILSAMGQAFFSLSLGMGAMVTYGSYLSKDDNLFTSAVSVAFTDTAVAFLAGLAIFPALFTVSGLTPEAGPGLIFMVLPTIFNKIPFGQLFGAGFFLLLAIAALTSSISLLEVVVAYFVDDRGWRRKRAVVAVGIATFIIGIPSALSLGGWSVLTHLIGKTGLMDIMDLIFGHFALTIGSLFLCLFIIFKWRVKEAVLELGRGASGVSGKVIRNIWPLFITWIAPLFITLLIAFLIVQNLIQ